MNDGPFETINISLPSQLLVFLRAAAAREDRTISGQVRHLIAQAARLAPPPSPPPRKALEHVQHTREGIADGKARLAALEQSRAEILQRHRRSLQEPAPAADDLRLRELIGEIDWLKSAITMAERFVGDAR